VERRWPIQKIKKKNYPEHGSEIFLIDLLQGKWRKI
jgi:hypothetical protein